MENKPISLFPRALHDLESCKPSQNLIVWFQTLNYEVILKPK